MVGKMEPWQTPIGGSFVRVALTREVSAGLADCELTHLERMAIDVARAREQHDAYEAVLRSLGCEVRRLGTTDALADSVFVEDQAVVVDELAIITRPGAESRRAEAPAIIEALRPHRRLVFLEAPATLDGGDVLVTGKDVFVGRSSRTNEAGIAQLTAALAPHGYRVAALTVTGCLHLKSAITAPTDDTFLLNPAWVTPPPGDRRLLHVDPREPHAANVLRLGDALVFPASFPATADRLVQLGCKVNAVELGELQKAEGAVTCCSLVFSIGAPP